METTVLRRTRTPAITCLFVMIWSETSCFKHSLSPGGWENARWGMNEEQVTRAFKEQVTPVNPDKASRAEGGKSAQSAFQIPEFDIDGRKFRVYFLFGFSHKLETVQLLLLSDNPYLVDATFKELESRLTEKYGPVAFTSDDDSLGRSFLFRGALSSKRGWKLSATTIELTYDRASQNGERRVGVRYISNEVRNQSTKGL
jgi:hypothetical protein